jgi:hypothetical protein
MANTYKKIGGYFLTSSASSVTFSSIPNTYTDLVVRCFVRSTRASTATDNIRVRFNGTTTGYTGSALRGFPDGSTNALQAEQTGSTTYLTTYSPSDQSTSATYSNTEIYIADYLGSINKPVFITSISENNTTTSPTNAWQVFPQAGKWANTAAITSIEFTSANAASIDAGSTFILYGIKKN